MHVLALFAFFKSDWVKSGKPLGSGCNLHHVNVGQAAVVPSTHTQPPHAE